MTGLLYGTGFEPVPLPGFTSGWTLDALKSPSAVLTRKARQAPVPSPCVLPGVRGLRHSPNLPDDSPESPRPTVPLL